VSWAKSGGRTSTAPPKKSIPPTKPAPPTEPPAITKRLDAPGNQDANNVKHPNDALVCADCTFINPPSVTHCILCDVAFPTHVRSPATGYIAVSHIDDEDGVVVFKRSYRGRFATNPDHEMTGGAGPAGTTDDAGFSLPTTPAELARILQEREERERRTRARLSEFNRAQRTADENKRANYFTDLLEQRNRAREMGLAFPDGMEGWNDMGQAQRLAIYEDLMMLAEQEVQWGEGGKGDQMQV
jgi:hypothetical protein